MTFKFGDVVRWRPDPINGYYDDGRYMVINLQHIGWGSGNGVKVICLIPPQDSEWEVGEDAPCDAATMEVVQ